ncbi:MAG: DUF1700 domain-containing protein [Oscillospiraceae bacterium]|nr:DUF1700 domain-containing protein [Oscillospiraceae bacterium]
MYRTKNEFLSGLEKELERAGITDRSEIIADFELHFADSTAQGLSETEICAKLGSISEIAKQYAEEEIYPVVAVVTDVGNDAHGVPPVETTPSASPPPLHGGESQEHNQAYDDYVNSGVKVNFGGFKKGFEGGSFNAGGLATVLIVDIFVLSWAIPALFSIVVAMLAVPFALVVTGLAMMIGGLVGASFLNFFSPLPGLVTFFTGLLLLSLGGLFALLGILFVKLFIKIIKSIIDWHGKMITGSPVFKTREVNA